MTSGAYDFLAQERVVWGQPAAEAVAAEADRLGAGRVFLVASRSLSRETDVVAAVREALAGRFAGLFDGCREHAPRPTVIEAADAAREAAPDVIVSLGGGTVIDTVKVVLIALAAGVTREEQLDDVRIGLDDSGRPHVPDAGVPPCRQIAVPTTLSGAEHSNLGGSLDPQRGVKDGYIARDAVPRSVILDASACAHTPEWLWLSTGIRAVDHAAESLCSVAPAPLVDGCATHALALLGEAMPASRSGDADAALRCLQGAWLAASGINRVPYGASHGIGHALGAVAGVSHGYTSCVMLPAVLRHNYDRTRERQGWIAQALGRRDADAPAAVAELIDALGLPRRLADVGVTDQTQLERIAAVASENMWVRRNPRPIESAGQVREILELAR